MLNNNKTPLKRPKFSYGNTKKLGKEIIEDFINITNKNAILLRFFNPISSESKGLLEIYSVFQNHHIG